MAYQLLNRYYSFIPCYVHPLILHMSPYRSSIKAIFTGGTIQRVTIDPNLGGCTLIEGGYPSVILPAGYIGSTLIGGAFILAGWDTLVAKIMSFVLAIGLICPLVLVRDKLCVFYPQSRFIG
jgi:hypothetical protein